MRIKQSVCIPMMKPADTPLEPFIARVAEIGFAAVEIWARDESLPGLMALARRYNLAVSCMIGHASLEVGMNDPDQHARILAELRDSLDVAAGSGIPNLICFSGTRRAGLSDEQGSAHTAACLERIAPYAEQKGVTLVLELLNSRYDHPGYQCDHAAWGEATTRRVNSPRVRLLYDIYHMQIMDGDIVRSIEACLDQIGHFHTGGVPGRNDIDSTNELNYTRICQAIAATPLQRLPGARVPPAGGCHRLAAHRFPNLRPGLARLDQRRTGCIFPEAG